MISHIGSKILLNALLVYVYLLPDLKKVLLEPILEIVIGFWDSLLSWFHRWVESLVSNNPLVFQQDSLQMRPERLLRHERFEYASLYCNLLEEYIPQFAQAHFGFLDMFAKLALCFTLKH